MHGTLRINAVELALHTSAREGTVLALLSMIRKDKCVCNCPRHRGRGRSREDQRTGCLHHLKLPACTVVLLYPLFCCAVQFHMQKARLKPHSLCWAQYIKWCCVMCSGKVEELWVGGMKSCSATCNDTLRKLLEGFDAWHDATMCNMQWYFGGAV